MAAIRTAHVRQIAFPIDVGNRPDGAVQTATRGVEGMTDLITQQERNLRTTEHQERGDHITPVRTGPGHTRDPRVAADIVAPGGSRRHQ